MRQLGVVADEYYFPVAIEPGKPRGPRGGATAYDTVNITDAVDWLRRLTPKEISEVQRNLARAGYFEQSALQGQVYMDGEPDDVTDAAWRRLIADSVSTNRPAMQVLSQKALVYREQLREANMRQMAAIDPNLLSLDANSVGQSMLGRNMTWQETRALQSQLEELRTQRAGWVAGADDNETATGLQGQEGFTTDDIAVKVQQMTQQDRFKNRMGATAYRFAKRDGMV